MKSKKVLKVLLAAILAVAILAPATAFAAAPTYTTQTTYDMGSQKALVTTTVYGLGAGEEVTYLAKSNDEIVYIDQKTVDSVDESTTQCAEFSFLTSTESATSKNTSVEVGSVSGKGTATTVGTDDKINLASGTVTLTTDGNGAVFAGDATAPSTTTTGFNGQTVTLYIAPATGYELASITKDGTAIDGTVISPSKASGEYALEVTGNVTVAFTFSKVEVTHTPPAVTKQDNDATPGYEVAHVDSDNEKNAMTSFASLTNISSATEYGILVSKSSEALSGITDETSATEIDAYGTNVKSDDGSKVYKFKTLDGSIAGKFGIQLIDGGTGYLTNTVYSKAYAKYNDGTNDMYVFGEMVTHAFTSGE